ncbi:hypothetical protein OAG16_04180 [Saprospiraceae bacterium]|nr:hypothetical protein [Saprospiraceae bacterium]
MSSHIICYGKNSGTGDLEPLQSNAAAGGGGDATAANQTTQITKLGEIDTALDTIDGVLDNSLIKQTAIDTKLATIETDIEATNTALTTIDGVLDNSLIKQTSIDTKLATIDGVLDSSLIKQTSIDTKLGTIETDIEATNTKLGTIETDIEATNTALGTIDGVLDATLVKITANETLLTAIDSDTNDIKTAVELLDNAVDGVNNYLNVNLNVDGTDITSNTGNVGATTPRVCIATNDIPIALVNTNLVALETSLTSMEAKMDTDNAVYDAMETHLGEIEGAVEVIESCVDGTNLKVAIQSGNGNETARLNIDTGSSELADDELTSSIDCSAFSEIAITFPTTQTDMELNLFVKGSTSSGGTYNTFATMGRKELKSFTGMGGGGTDTYVWGTGSDQRNSTFIPCIYPHIKIENKSGTNFAASDNIRIIGK